MYVRIFTLFLFISLAIKTPTKAQNFCPTNVDVELGNFTNWLLYTGSCCPLVTPVQSGQVANRHVITSGSGVDPYGGFPIVAPGGGNHSIKLGNHFVASEAERARYYVHVPSGVNNYSLIYRYAVVFQDPGHLLNEQPRFMVRAFDSATNTTLPCAEFTYIATSNLPGFQFSTVGSNVWYKSWTTATLNLSGWAGHTVAVDFSTGDCSLGAHFGYGYVDVSCGLFQISGSACNDPFTTLNAPPGFQNYTWTNANYTSVVGSGQSITIPTPSTTTTYHVILTPYNGFGCPDTLTTVLNISDLAVNATNDTTVCQGSSIQLSAGASGSMQPFTYSWTPSTGLSCTSCANPVATINGNMTYYLTVTDTTGCPKYDTVHVNAGTFTNISTTTQMTSCPNTSDGSATATPLNGTAPYTYSWNTQPVQTTQTATNLAAGTYTVTITDNAGCIATATATVTAPTAVSATVSTTPAACYGQASGTATATGAGGTGPYTYSWNTQPVQNTQTATSLSAGNTYIATVTDAHGCTGTASATVSQPTPVNATVSAVTGSTCTTPGNATVIASGGTPGYTYSWNTQPVQTTQTATNIFAGTYIATVTDANGCTDTAIAIVPQLQSSLNVVASHTNVTCNGLSNGNVAAVATGGTPGYTYSWNTQPVQTTQMVNGLPAGTYTVTVTDNLGCTQTATTTISQPAVLTGTATNTSPSCNGQSNGTATVVASGGTPGYTYSWNTQPVQTTATATNLPAGAYTVSITDANGCTGSATTTVNQPPVLNATISGSTNALCGGLGNATVSVTGGTPGYTYSWNTQPVQTTATATNLNGGTYTVTVTDTKGCIATATVTIIQSAALGIIMNETDISCNGMNDGSVSTTIIGGTGPYVYTWSNNQTTSSINGLSPGTYTVDVTDNGGCTGTATANITQPNVLNAFISNISNVSCFGGSNGTAHVAVNGGTQPYNYQWNTMPVQTTSTATSLTAGSYNVTVTDTHGCIDTASINITEPAPLIVDITNSTPATCGDPNGNATALASGGTAPYTYSWNTLPVQTTATASNLTGGTYTVTATDNKGCVATAIVNLTQSPALNASITATNVTCNSAGNGVATAVLTGGTQPFTYNWNNNQSTLSINNLAPGTYNINATDAAGCTASASVIITEPAVLDATISNVNNIKCYGEHNGSAMLDVTGGTQPYSYLWSNGSTQPSPTSLGAGSYNVTITDANGCIDTASMEIIQPEELLLTADALTKTCEGSANGSAEATVSGGTAPYAYAWSSAPVQTTSSAAGLYPGTYTITVTDANGCTKTASINIEGYSLPTVNAGPDQVYCYGIDSIVLSATGATNYEWSPANSLACNTCATTAANPSSTTTYEVIGIDNNNCRDTDQVVVTVYTRQATSVGADLDICKGTTAQLSASGGIEYQWTPDPQSSESASAPIVSPDSDMVYTVIITQNQCFSDTLMQAVHVHLPPTVDLGRDQKVLPGSLVQIHADTTNATRIEWTPVTNLSCDDCIDPTARIDAPIVYKATVYNKGCQAEDEIFFDMSCDGATIFIANTFTPNNDGANDRFFPQSPGSDMIKVFRVYNRWGDLMHEARNFYTNDDRYGWDGTFKGRALPPDVYVYYLETSCPNGDVVFKKGDISLIK